MPRPFLSAFVARLLVGLCGAMPLAPTAWAHAHLLHAAPPIDGTVASAPPVLTLVFSEKLEPRFCTVQVLNAAGQSVSAGEIHLAANDDHTLVVGLPKLPPGAYTVIWRATSADTHRTEGRYTFHVAP